MSCWGGLEEEFNFEICGGVGGKVVYVGFEYFVHLHVYCIHDFVCDSGQIIATSHDLGPQKVAKKAEIPLFQGNLGLWNIISFGQNIHIHVFIFTYLWVLSPRSSTLHPPPCFYFLGDPKPVRKLSNEFSSVWQKINAGSVWVFFFRAGQPTPRRATYPPPEIRPC